MLSQFTASIICRKEGEYICMSRVWVNWVPDKTRGNRFLLNFNQNSSFTFSLGKWLHRQLNIKSCPSLRFVPVCCGYFGNCCSTWGWGVGWLGGVLVSMVCCGAFVRYLFIFKMYCHLLNTLQVVWTMNMYFAPSLFVLFLFINTKQTLNMDSLLIGINVERTLRHRVTKRKTQIFTSAQKTSGFPLNLGILRAVT